MSASPIRSSITITKIEPKMEPSPKDATEALVSILTRRRPTSPPTIIKDEEGRYYEVDLTGDDDEDKPRAAKKRAHRDSPYEKAHKRVKLERDLLQYKATRLARHAASGLGELSEADRADSIARDPSFDSYDAIYRRTCRNLSNLYITSDKLVERLAGLVSRAKEESSPLAMELEDIATGYLDFAHTLGDSIHDFEDDESDQQDSIDVMRETISELQVNVCDHEVEEEDEEF